MNVLTTRVAAEMLPMLAMHALQLRPRVRARARVASWQSARVSPSARSVVVERAREGPRGDVAGRARESERARSVVVERAREGPRGDAAGRARESERA
jgi:hypothetical protein